MVAHRVAHALTEQGDKVDYLAILDSTLHRNELVEKPQRYQCLEHALKYAVGEGEDIAESESVLAQLPLDFKNRDYPQQLEVAVQLLGEGALADFADKEQLVMALKCFVNLMKADRPLTPIRGNKDFMAVEWPNNTAIPWPIYLLYPEQCHDQNNLRRYHPTSNYLF